MTVENARDILARYPDRVELLDLPEGGIRVAIRPDPNTSLKIAAGLVIACVSSFVVGRVVGWLRHNGELNLPFVFARQSTFYGLSIFFLALGSFFGLIRWLNGPPKPTVFDVYPGRLKIDRYVAGDHVVRQYAPNEVRQFFVDGASLTFNTRMDDFSVLVAFCPRDIRIATAWGVGAVFWGTSAAFLEGGAPSQGPGRKGRRIAVHNPHGGAENIPPPRPCAPLTDLSTPSILQSFS